MPSHVTKLAVPSPPRQKLARALVWLGMRASSQPGEGTERKQQWKVVFSLVKELAFGSQGGTFSH